MELTKSNKLIQRIRSAWRRHDIRDFLRLVVVNARHYATNANRSWRGSKYRDEFDRSNSSQTGQIREVGSLTIDSPNSVFAVRYEPSSESIVCSAIESISIDYTGFTFIDFGSGMGRVLMIAARYPFKRVIGIEFAAELHRIAQENIRGMSLSQPVGDRVLSVCADAAKYELPPESLVCYFYNPFESQLLARVAERLVAHVASGHNVYVLYVNPRHREVMDRNSRFGLLRSTSNLAVYEVHGVQ